MSSAFLLRSALPRTFKAASGRSALLAAVQGQSSPVGTERPVADILCSIARHASTSTTPYVPGGPIIQGTVNDPTAFPESNRSHGSYHWAFERLLSAGLVPLTAAAFATSGSNYPILDGILGVSLIMHSHIGFDSILVDYVHKRKFPILGPVSTWGLRTVTVGVLVGVYSFNTNDIGLTELITKVWHA